MSLEKSIQKLTQVIQAAQLYSAQAIVGGPSSYSRERCTTMPRGGQTVCECQELNADGSVKTNGRVTITPGACQTQGDRPMQTPRVPVAPRRPAAPTEDYPMPQNDGWPSNPVPQYGWDCYWARKRMEEDPNNMGTCCFDPSTPVPHTKICYSRSSPGGPITVTQTRED